MGGIPIDLARYAPQTQATGQQVGNGTGSGLFATGQAIAGSMARGSMALASGLGDLATGVDRLGDGLRIRQEKIDREQALADEAGSVAFWAGLSTPTEEKLRNAQNIEVLDSVLADTKTQADSFRTGKGEQGFPHLRTADSRQAFERHAQIKLAQFKGLADARRLELDRDAKLADFASLEKSMTEQSVYDPDTAARLLGERAENMVAAGVLPEHKKAAELEKSLAQMSAYAADAHVSEFRAAPVAASTAELNGRVADLRNRFERLKAYAPHGSMSKWETGLKELKAWGEREMEVADADAVQACANELEKSAMTARELAMAGRPDPQAFKVTGLDEFAKSMRTESGKAKALQLQAQVQQTQANLANGKLEQAEFAVKTQLTDLKLSVLLGSEKITDAKQALANLRNDPKTPMTSGEDILGAVKFLESEKSSSAEALLVVGTERFKSWENSGLFKSRVYDSNGKDVTEERRRNRINEAETNAEKLELQAAFDKQDRMKVQVFERFQKWVDEHPDAKPEEARKWLDGEMSPTIMTTFETANKAAWGL